MRNLIQNSPNKILNAHKGHEQHCGLLMSPDSMRSMDALLPFIEQGGVWALDNFCFVNYSPQNVLSMLKRYQGLPNCLFAVVPDSPPKSEDRDLPELPNNHDETMLLFRAWLGTYQSLGYPIAFVLQNGARVDNVPYNSIDAVFIGGDNDFKKSQDVRDIVIEAKRRGKWVHAGRVNSQKRIKTIWDIDCDSFDGTGYSRALDTNVKAHLPHYTNKQKTMFQEIGL